jgi:hypothetical protein
LSQSTCAWPLGGVEGQLPPTLKLRRDSRLSSHSDTGNLRCPTEEEEGWRAGVTVTSERPIADLMLLIFPSMKRLAIVNHISPI